MYPYKWCFNNVKTSWSQLNGVINTIKIWIDFKHELCGTLITLRIKRRLELGYMCRLTDIHTRYDKYPNDPPYIMALRHHFIPIIKSILFYFLRHIDISMLNNRRQNPICFRWRENNQFFFHIFIYFYIYWRMWTRHFCRYEFHKHTVCWLRWGVRWAHERSRQWRILVLGEYIRPAPTTRVRPIEPTTRAGRSRWQYRQTGRK